MSTTKPVTSQQLPQCHVCNLDPVPQSTQHVILLILEVCLLFINWKFSVILLMVGYSFPRTHWKCPYCSRDIPYESENENQNISNSVVFRMGKCMAVFSLNKFRIFTFIVIAWMGYLLATQPRLYSKKLVIKSWQGLVQSCGFQVYMENSVRSNHHFSDYLDSGFDWQLQGIFLGRQNTGVSKFQNIYIKMDPSQFKDPQAYDFKAFTKIAVDMQFQKGDVLLLKGQWQGRQYHHFIFNPLQIIKTGKHKDPSTVGYYYEKKSLLRSHLDAVKQEYTQNSNDENLAKSLTKQKQQPKTDETNNAKV